MLAQVFPFSFCLFCASLIRKESGACNQCLKILLDRTVPNERQIYGFTVRSLFDWKRDLHPEVSKLVMGLKAGANKDLWNPLADKFLSLHWTELMNLVHGSALLPVPSKRQSNHDHAFLFAQALSLHSGIPLKMGGRPAELGSQKTKSIHERKLIQFRGRHNIDPETQKVILVDDILTTGGTAKALIQFVERQRRNHGLPRLHWEIWVLAYRQHLASNR